MIIGFIGNCQSRETANCLARHYPEHDVKYYFTGKPEDLKNAENDIDQLDVIVSQWLPPSFGRLETSKLRIEAKSFISAPLFSFTGFQPDITYVKSNGKDFASPVGAYHSRIVVCSYLAGIPEERVSKLFNSYIYRTFGYFDEYEISKSRFDENFKRLGLDISTEELSGTAFMHTLNHPTAYAVSIISKALANKIGLITDSWSVEEDLAHDGLSEDTIWPVYPELALEIGVQGDLSFKPHHRFIQQNRSKLNLDELISESYEKYKERPVDIDNLSEFIETLRREVRI